MILLTTKNNNLVFAKLGGLNMNTNWECDKCSKKIVSHAYLLGTKCFCSKQCYDKYIEEITIKNIKKLKKR